MPTNVKPNRALSVSRRSVLKTGSGLAACLAAGTAPAVIARAQETLIVNSQGGEYQQIFEDTVIRPFEQQFNVSVVHDPTGTASQDFAKIRASGGSPGFDVAAVLNPPEIILGAREGLLAPITQDKVPNLARVWPEARDLIPEYGAPHTVQYASLIYNKEKIERPTSWADYWAPGETYGEEIKNHVIGFNPGNLLSIFALLHAAGLGGGSAEDMEPAWEYLQNQKPYLGVVVTGSSEAVPHFESGQVWISPYWSARAALYIDRGLPFEMVIPKEGVFGLIDIVAIPSGAANKDLAYEFVNFRLSKDVQRNFSLAYHSGPSRDDLTDLPPEFLERQIASKEKIEQTIWPDLETIGEKRKEWTLRWQEIMA
jgi:putative spermidine/putrescine transport system substrate-binding protein